MHVVNYEAGNGSHRSWQADRQLRSTRSFTNHRRRDRESNVALLGPPASRSVVNAKFTVTRIGLWIMIKYSSSSYLNFSGCDGDEVDKHANQRPLRRKEDEATEATEAVTGVSSLDNGPLLSPLENMSRTLHSRHLDWSLHSRSH